MILPVMSRTTLLGYGWVVAAAISLAVLSFGLWVHHMFTTGMPAISSPGGPLGDARAGCGSGAWRSCLRQAAAELGLLVAT